VQRSELSLDSLENITSGFFSNDGEHRLEKARKDIARRLKRICSNLSEEDFQSLVEKMAKEQLRSEGLS